MKNNAIKYYNMGYNCSACMFKAIEEKYNIHLPKEFENGINLINNGFGFCGMCGVLISGVIILGMILGEEKGRMARMKLFDYFFEKYKYTDCGRISMNSSECSDVISFVCDIIDKIALEMS